MPDLTIDATRCPHGKWDRHNALLLEDGTVIDDPDGPCLGGYVVVNGRRVGISHMLASALDSLLGDTDE